MNSTDRINRIAEDIAADRREDIADLADVVWYVTEQAAYEPLNEADFDALVAAVSSLLGVTA